MKVLLSTGIITPLLRCLSVAQIAAIGHEKVSADHHPELTIGGDKHEKNA
jgi:hypothetical protein